MIFVFSTRGSKAKISKLELEIKEAILKVFPYYDFGRYLFLKKSLREDVGKLFDKIVIYYRCGKFHYRYYDWHSSDDRSFNNHDEIFYRIVSDIIFEYASEFELYNRIDSQDFRRQLFEKEMKYAEKVSASFAEKMKTEIDGILKRNPYNDCK